MSVHEKNEHLFSRALLDPSHFGGGVRGVFHTDDMCFVSGSKWCSQVSWL